MKKEIALITLPGNFNYGNKLQNYAGEQLLSRCGFEPVTLYDLKIRYMPEKVEKCLRHILHRLRHDPGQKPLDIQKESRFAEWSSGHLHLEDGKIRSPLQMKKLLNRFDMFVVGSDQVWNPDWKDYRMYLLPFVPENRKISLAASLGMDHIPTEAAPYFRKGLASFRAVSVREENAVQLMAEMGRPDAQWVSDPTLMLTDREWAAMEKRPACFGEEKYICVYSLGNLPARVSEQIQNLASEHGWSVKLLNHEESPELYSLDPSEFLYAVHHAELLVTDSFHGSVFSLLFHTPFLVYERQDQLVNMSSRLNSLLHLFEMEHRKMELCPVEQWLECDFSAVDRILESERKKEMTFLKENLA